MADNKITTREIIAGFLKVIAFTFFGFLIFVIGLVGLYYIWKWDANRHFAQRFFKDKVEVVRVIATKKWHYSDDRWRACSYAAVEFSENTAKTLEEEGPDALKGYSGSNRRDKWLWRGGWRPTPVEEWQELKSRMSSSPLECLKYFPKADADVIMGQLLTEGSWYRYGLHSDRLAFLSADSRIAATMRFGD